MTSKLLWAFVIAVAILQSILIGATNEVQASKQVTAAEIGTAAVISFEGSKGDVFSDLVAHELLLRGVVLVDRTKIAAVLKERDTTLEDLTAGRLDIGVIRDLVNVDTLVLGSVTPITVYVSGAASGRVSVATFRLVDVKSGRILSSVSFNSNTEILARGKTYGTAAVMMVEKLVPATAVKRK